MKAPRLKRPELMGSGNELLHELRERHLLLPIAGLVAALAAVPFLLGGSSSEEPGVPMAPIVSSADGAQELEPAVLLDQPGVRNYRDRLDALRKQNPFEQKFSIDPESDTIAVTGGATGDPSVSLEGDAPSGAASPSPAPSTASVSSSTPSTAPPPSEPAAPASASNGAANGAVKAPKPEIRYYAGRIDVKMGPVGSLKIHENVRYLEFLPSAKEPVVTFVGLSHDGEKAVFAVSREVTETDGEGSCAPKRPAPCQFVRLAQGEERTFAYGDDGPVYRMKLLDARIVRVPKLGN